MLRTNNLVIIAVGFGGILQQMGAVESMLGGFIKKVKTPFLLIVVTLLTSMFRITTMCDRYLGLIIPSGMYKERFDELGLARNMLPSNLTSSLMEGGFPFAVSLRQVINSRFKRTVFVSQVDLPIFVEILIQKISLHFLYFAV